MRHLALALPLVLAWSGCATLIGADFDDKESCIGTCDIHAPPTKAPAVVARAQEALSELAAHGDSVFWINGSSTASDGKILGCETADCKAGPKVLASQQQGPRGLAVDESQLYWGTYEGQVMACSRSGCTQGGPSAIYDSGGEGLVNAVATDGTFVYWVGSLLNMPGAVLRCPVEGCAGEPTQLAGEQPGPKSIAVGGGSVAWVTIGDGESANRVFACPLDGCAGEPTLLASGQANVHSLVLAGSTAYWSTYAMSGLGGKVMSCALEGCADSPQTLLAVETKPWGVAVGDGTLYFTDAYEQTVRKCKLADCPIRTGVLAAVGQADPVPPGLDSPLNLALGAHDVFWLSPGDGVIARAGR